MSLDPKVIGELAIAALLVAINLPPIVKWVACRLPTLKPAAPVAPVDRTPGEVLDCLNSDMEFLRQHTDAPPEVLKAFEAAAPYLMHGKQGA